MNNEKYSIAIIDDETEILNVLSRFLIRNPNFSVNTYSNPISGIKFNRKHKSRFGFIRYYDASNEWIRGFRKT